MYVERTTTAAVIVETLCSTIMKEDKEELIAAIEKYGEASISRNQELHYNEKINRIAKQGKTNWHLAKPDMEMLEAIADLLSPVDKANLMQLSYEDILLIKKNREKGIYGELKELLKSKLVDIYYDLPFSLATCLDFLELPYTEEKFLQLLKQNKLPKDRVESVMDFIKTDYKVLDPAI